MDKKLQEFNDRYTDRKDYRELQSFMSESSGSSHEDIYFDKWKLEYEIMLGNEHFRLKCQKALGSRMPLLDETAAGLVNLYEEEQKVRGLLSQILLNQGKEYTIEMQIFFS